MRQRLPGERHEIDIEKTVEITIDTGGFPSFQYKPVTRPPEYLLLIDLSAHRDHFASFVNHIGKTLENEGIFVDCFFYRTDPQVCFQTGSNVRHNLGDLRSRYSHCRLLLAGSGEGLLDPVTGKLESWTQRELLLGSRFIVLPATLEGFEAVTGFFDSSDGFDVKEWVHQDNSADRVFRNNGADIVEQLRTYLKNEKAFQWLCACAVYPELQWSVTLHLGNIIYGGSGIDQADLLRLIRLPWFRQGVIPEKIRLKLLAFLDKEILKEVQNEIFRLLQKNPPPKESYAYDAYELNLAIHRLPLFSKK